MSLNRQDLNNHTRRSRLMADLTLLCVALIWGSAFVVQRIAAGQVGVFTFNGLRFLLGALALLPFVRKQNSSGSGRDLLLTGGVILAGGLMAFGAAFQQAGLRYTTAGNAGFITGLYVVLIPLFLGVSMRRRPRLVIWLSALLAAAGLFLLSTGGVLQVNQGDGLVFISSIFWALHVILIDWMVRRMDVLRFAFGQYLVCGALSLSLGFVLEPGSLIPTLEQWWLIAYTGVLSVGLGYTLQAVGQRVAPPADAAIILSLEAVFAAFSGWVFLNENLSPVQLTGCGVMLLGMLLAQSDVILGGRAAAAQMEEM